MPALRRADSRMKYSNLQNKVSYRILQRIEHLDQSLRLLNLGLMPQFSREFNNNYSVNKVREPSIQSASTLMRHYWLKYDGFMLVKCQFHVGYMSVYQIINLEEFTDNQKFRLKTMSDVSRFQKIIRNILAYLIKMIYLCSIKTLKSIKTNKTTEI